MNFPRLTPVNFDSPHFVFLLTSGKSDVAFHKRKVQKMVVLLQKKSAKQVAVDLSGFVETSAGQFHINIKQTNAHLE